MKSLELWIYFKKTKWIQTESSDRLIMAELLLCNSKVLSLLRQLVKSINSPLCKRQLYNHVTGGWRSRTFVVNGSLINSNRCVKIWSTYRSQNSRPSYYRNNGSKPAKYLSLFNSRGLFSKVVGCCSAVGYIWIVLRSRWARSFDYTNILTELYVCQS